MSDFDERTRVTAVVQVQAGNGTSTDGGDCLVVIHTKEPTLLGKRFVLHQNPTRVGRGVDNEVVLDGDSVSRRHAQLEHRGTHWLRAPKNTPSTDNFPAPSGETGGYF